MLSCNACELLERVVFRQFHHLFWEIECFLGNLSFVIIKKVIVIWNSAGYLA